jgi:undecaprenyl pyrophosphate phosphatase UppP
VTLAFASAAVSAFLVVRWLLQFVRGHSFNGFAIYRIIFGRGVASGCRFTNGRAWNSGYWFHVRDL